MARLKEYYRQTLIPQLQKSLGYSNVHSVPRLSKIVMNMGLGEAVADNKKLQNAVSDLSLISGQKPVVTYAKRSISQFKLRKGMAIGCKVTLRRDRMYEFLDRLITINLPRIRDFRGFSASSFDGYGNFNFGLKDQIIFPEIDYDKIDKVRGLDIALITTAHTNQEAKTLLKSFNLPFID